MYAKRKSMCVEEEIGEKRPISCPADILLDQFAVAPRDTRR